LEDHILVPDLYLRDSGLILRRLLGIGAQGQVWECEDTTLKKKLVAAKILAIPSQDRTGDTAQAARRRMDSEIEHLSNVDHENVVIIKRGFGEFFEEHLITGYTMELSEMGDARATINMHAFSGPVSTYLRQNLRWATLVLRQLLRGLSALHAKGRIHSDLKPHNVLLFPSEHRPFLIFKLTDFGITRLVTGEIFSNEGIQGTPSYMPPEQFKQPATTKSDIYSLGLTFFEILTGRSRLDFSSCGRDDIGCIEEVHRTGLARVLADCGIDSPYLDALLNDMTRPNELDRPDLPQIMRRVEYLLEEAYKRKEERGLFDESVPRYLFAPAVHEQRKEQLRFALLQLDRYGLRERVLRMITDQYSDRYSRFEVFGSYDIIIRIWLTDEQWEELRARIASQFPANTEAATALQPYEFHTISRIEYVWAGAPEREFPEPEHTPGYHGGDLLALNTCIREATKHDEHERAAPLRECQRVADRLIAMGLIIRELKPDAPNQIRAYVVLRPTVSADDQWRTFLRAVEDSPVFRKRAEEWQLTLYLAKPCIIVETVVPRYPDLHGVLDLLGNHFRAFVGTNTYLDTGAITYITDAWQ
jgi:serine/threonine protein kinase